MSENDFSKEFLQLKNYERNQERDEERAEENGRAIKPKSLLSTREC
jgi:hypothetical protein